MFLARRGLVARIEDSKMNTRQHSNSKHLQRLFSALLPGGLWLVSRFLAAPRPAELVAIHAMKCPATHNRMNIRGYRKA